jgi:hypothetical protein
MYRTIRRAWRGRERLWKVWWLYGVPVLITEFLFTICVDTPYHGLTATMSKGLLALVSVLWCIAAWRCARNTDSELWMFSARALITLHLACVYGVIVGA